MHIELNVAQNPKRRGNDDTTDLQLAPLKLWQVQELSALATAQEAFGNRAVAKQRTLARRQSVQKLPVKQSSIIPSLNMETAALDAGNQSREQHVYETENDAARSSRQKESINKEGYARTRGTCA